MKGLLKILLSSQIVLVSLTYSGEVDHFSRKFQVIKDSAEVMNSIANSYLAKSVQEANSTSSSCNEKTLYKKMRNYFSNHKTGEITIFALNDPRVDKIKLKISDSVYKEWSYRNGSLLASKSSDGSNIVLSPLMRIGSQVIGTDKFEHLFGRGFAYFTDHYLNKKTLKHTLKIGVREEKIIYGGNFLATGVFSYADLSANFNGMRFWNHILLQRVDILGPQFNLGPYVVCKNNKFEINETTKIDFTKYFDASYDESINCSKFANSNALEKFNRSLNSLNLNESTNIYKCPMDKTLLSAMVEKYGDFSIHFINTQGNLTVNYFAEFTSL